MKRNTIIILSVAAALWLSGCSRGQAHWTHSDNNTLTLTIGAESAGVLSSYVSEQLRTSYAVGEMDGCILGAPPYMAGGGDAALLLCKEQIQGRIP